MKKCPQCGAENHPGAKFCGMCRADFSKKVVVSQNRPFRLTKVHVGIVVGLVIAVGIYTFMAQPGGINSDSASKLSADALNKRGDQAFANKDYVTAGGWYALSADKGDKVAENLMGWLAQNGYGMKKDNELAFKWFSKSAAQGLDAAQTNLGWCYQNGIGVQQNYGTAIQWYKKAVAQKNDSAEINMGYLYENGIGVEKDFSEAKRWYQMAASQGSAEAKKDLDMLEAKQVNLNAIMNKGMGQ